MSTKYVYFVQAKDGPIKIGCSKFPLSRLRQLELENKFGSTLELLGCVEGGFALEKEYHRAMKEHRVAGEWFEAAPTLEFLRGLELVHPPAEPDPILGFSCSESLADRIKEEARKQGLTVSQVMRQAVRAHFEAKPSITHIYHDGEYHISSDGIKHDDVPRYFHGRASR